MNINGVDLTPASAINANETNYTWWKYDTLEGFPFWAGYVFHGPGAKRNFAEQVYRDYEESGLPEAIIRSGPEGWEMGEFNVIGRDGFGWYHSDMLHRWQRRFPHIGGVFIGDGVEIGSFVTIDRGALNDTIIETGVKIDSHVHVGHNARILVGAMLSAGCIIGGSAVIGERTWVGLGAVVKNGVTVGDDVTIGMGAVVTKDVPSGQTVAGVPARPM
jgi:acetyltransferase-like isoleucine patch superfamily enzyme